VAARRLLILMLVLLGVSTVAAALVPVDRNAGGDDTTTTSTSTAEPPTGKLKKKSIDAAAEKPKTVRVQVGDQLQLRVMSRRAGEVEIPALDELEDVDPAADAHFDLLLFETGKHEVRLVESGRRIGRIIVTSPQRRSKQPTERAAKPSDGE
jgi:plastocyanin